MKTFFLALLILVAPAIARDVVDVEYAISLLQRLESDKFDYWQGMNQQPSGGYIFRFELDVTGDGQNEVFLASSLTGDHRSVSWTVFTRKDDGWITSSQMILLNPSGIYIKTQAYSKSSALGGWARMSGSNYWINQYQFQADGTFMEQDRDVSVLTEDERHELGSESWIERNGLGRKVSPAMSKMLFAELLSDPASKWRPYDLNLPANAQHQQDQERIRIGAISDFSPEQAKNFLAGFEHFHNRKKPNGLRQPTIIQPMRPSKEPNLAQPKPEFPNEKPSASAPWNVIVILIVAAGGLLWLLLKRSS